MGNNVGGKGGTKGKRKGGAQDTHERGEGQIRTENRGGKNRRKKTKEKAGGEEKKKKGRGEEGEEPQGGDGAHEIGGLECYIKSG